MPQQNPLLRAILSFGFCLLLCSAGKAQLVDDFAAPGVISIPNQGYAMGTYSGVPFPMAQATTENNEYFPDDLVRNALIEKSIWYSFAIPDVRNVQISLKQQDTGIQQQDIGFAVYKDPGGFAGPHKLSSSFPVMVKIGHASNTCLQPGTYFIQVGARKRVMDSVWVELELGRNLIAACELSTPLVFSKLLPSTSQQVELSECGYLPDEDFSKFIAPGQYNQMYNLQFEVQAIHDMHDLEFDMDPDYWNGNRHFKVVLLEEDSTLPFTYWRLVDSTTFVPLGWKYKNQLIYNCQTSGSLKPGNYRILVFCQRNTLKPGQVFLSRGKSKTIDLPNQRVIPLGDTPRVVRMDLFNCAAGLDKSLCPALNDTLTGSGTHEGWYTFETREEWYFLIVASASAYKIPLRLYKGDVATSCQLVEVNPERTGAFCLEPAVYSLRLLYWLSPEFLKYPTKLEIDRRPIIHPVFLFADSLNPENIGDISGVLPNTILSQKSHFEFRNQKLIAGTDTVEGPMQYREFYVSSPKPFRMVVAKPGSQGYLYESAYLFKGRKSNGTGSLFLQEVNGVYENTCGTQDTGWYTLVSIDRYPDQCVLANQAPYSIEILPTEDCPAFSRKSSTTNPILVNGGQPLLPGSTTIDGLPYKDLRSYLIEHICFGCGGTDSAYSDWLLQHCHRQPLSDQPAFNFLEFNLAEEMELNVSFAGGAAGFYLVQGSVKTNQGLLYDSTAYIEPCLTSRKFCRLQPGTYTLVLVSYPGIVLKGCVLGVLPVIEAANDLLENFQDIGLINLATKTKPVLLNCTVTSDSSDVIMAHISGSQISNPADTGINRGIAVNGEKSIWYAFELDGLGVLGILSNTEYKIYEIPDHVPLAAWKGDASKRDSMAKLAKLVFSATATSQARNFENGYCKRRQFLLGVADRGTTARLPKFEFTWTPVSSAPKLPDKCSANSIIDMTAFGKQSAKLDVRCLTIGEGFGEDGNNMACLPVNVPYTTAWARVHIAPGDKYDVSFSLKIIGGSFGNGNVKYRILYGACSALTPGPCVENINASFGFECMEAGDYFFQIVVPEDARGFLSLPEQLEIVVEISPTKIPVCRPFDPFQPLASFAFEGNCQADSVRFKNYSSQGDSIAYLWTFSDGQSSTARDPVLWFNPNGTYNDIVAKLWVTNVSKNKSDSFERVLRVWKHAISIDVPFTDTTVRCGTWLDIEALTNVADGVFLHAFNLGDTVLGNTISRHFTGYNMLRFMVYASGCFADTVLTVRTHQNLNRFPEDTVLCRQQQLFFNVHPYTNAEWNPGAVKSTSIHITQPGQYVVSVPDSGCLWRDTIRVADRQPVFDHGTDTLACSMDSLKLEIRSDYTNYVWYDGSTKKTNWVKNDGSYWVEGKWGSCLNRDSIEVQFVQLNNALAMDSAYLCRGDEVQVSSGLEADSYVWSNGQTTRTMTESLPGKYGLRLQTGYCQGFDTVYLEYFPDEIDLGNDISFCSVFSRQFDAGEGSDYAWWPVYSDNRYLLVQDSGTYGVSKTNRYGCLVEDTVRVFENCGPYFLLPTAFTPNGDGVNDILMGSSLDITAFEFRIYDRWGGLVFTSSDPSKGWDGNYLGQPVAAGVYMYQVFYGGEDYLGAYHKKNHKGTFVLYR